MPIHVLRKKPTIITNALVWIFSDWLCSFIHVTCTVTGVYKWLYKLNGDLGYSRVCLGADIVGWPVSFVTAWYPAWLHYHITSVPVCACSCHSPWTSRATSREKAHKTCDIGNCCIPGTASTHSITSSRVLLLQGIYHTIYNDIQKRANSSETTSCMARGMAPR